MKQWLKYPFPHCVVDDFLPADVANQIAEEFPKPSSDVWFRYDNEIEKKLTCNDWGKFPPSIYSTFQAYVEPSPFLIYLRNSVNNDELIADYGLHGGGMHCHPNGGKLNPHLDYAIHPKTLQQRKVNLIYYVTPGWQESWGGHLGLWENDNGQPGRLATEILPKFNRAVLFDTTNAWHGLSREVKCPEGMSRNSLAIYYTIPPEEGVEDRRRALFAPTEEQKNSAKILQFCKDRSR